MTGTLATLFSAFFSPSPPRGMIRSTSPSWVASSSSCSWPPPESSETEAAGSSAAASASAIRPARKALELSALLEPAEDRRIAALQAERGGVDRHVRPCLVDDRDHADRNPLLGDLEPVGERPPLDDLPDRILEAGDLAHAVRHLGDPRLGQRQPVDQRLVEALLAPDLDVRPIRVEQRRGARIDPIREITQAGILLIPARPREQVRGVLRLATELDDRLRCGGHAQRVTTPSHLSGW